MSANGFCFVRVSVQKRCCFFPVAACLHGPCRAAAQTNLCAALTTQTKKQTKKSCDITHPNPKMDLLECPICLFLMSEPVTMSCGHTFCRRCVGGSLPPRCPSCKERFKQREAKNIRNNVLLIGVIEKCCPEETKVKCLVQEKLKANEFREALRVATEGLDLGKRVEKHRRRCSCTCKMQFLFLGKGEFLFWMLM